MKYLIGLDLGTSSCKAIAIDLNGNIVAEASESYELKTRGEYIEQRLKIGGFQQLTVF